MTGIQILGADTSVAAGTVAMTVGTAPREAAK